MNVELLITTTNAHYNYNFWESSIIYYIAMFSRPKDILRLVFNPHLSRSVTKLSVSQYGEPLQVLRIEEESIAPPKSKEVLVEILAAPVNPVDINIIQGKYIVRFPLPFVPGYEGVGRVVEVGSEVVSFEEGDHVVPLKPCTGTWRTHITLPESVLLKVPSALGLNDAATLICNSSTAYSMLKTFTDLSPGDTIIQNGGNSSCGQLVIQLCKLWGINSVNIVRDRPEITRLKQFLTDLGATYVLTEEELRKTDIFKTKKIDKPRLALNCIGGKIATEVSRHLQPGGYLVTYGGMSMEPVIIPTSALIFNDIRVLGFNMTRWIEMKENEKKREAMLQELIKFSLEGKLIVPKCVQVDFVNYAEAISKTLASTKEFTKEKYILRFAKS